MIIPADFRELPDGLHHTALDDGARVVVKRRRAAPDGFFAAEVYGLERLRASNTLRVPLVYGGDAHTLILEDLGSGQSGTSACERAGRALARMHAHVADEFGLDRHGWCGDSPQDNTANTDGWKFFAERRLLPQGVRARDAGLLTAADLNALELLCTRLRELIPAQPPSLVHGDLWLANLHSCADGELALIDAGAVHYGWAEADLAMMTLFGDMPATIFAAYDAETRGDRRWRSRAPIYNLYHLLNHLNLFGHSYLPRVHAVLQRFD